MGEVIIAFVVVAAAAVTVAVAVAVVVAVQRDNWRLMITLAMMVLMMVSSADE